MPTQHVISRPHSPIDPQEWFTCSDVARYLRLSEKTPADKRWRVKVGLRGYRVGHSIRFKASDVARLAVPELLPGQETVR